MKTATRILHSIILIVLLPVSLFAQWVPVSAPVGNEIDAVMVRNATNDSSIFILNQGAYPWYSTDNGATWKEIANAPRTPNMLSFGPYVFMVQGNAGVARISKSSSGWSREISVQMPHGSSVNTLASKGSYLLAGTDYAGVCRSTDYGASWSAAGSWFKTVDCLAVNGTRIFAGTDNSGVFVSTDDGANWSQATAGIPDSAIISLAASAGTSGSGAVNIFAVTSHGVFVSRNNGSSWASANAGLPAINGYDNRVNGLAVIGTDVYAAIEGSGVYVTRNDGASWTDVTNNLSDVNVNCVSAIGTKLYAGTTACDLFVSTNRAASWTQLRTDGRTTVSGSSVGTYTHPNGGGTTVFFAANKSIFRSTDRGLTWKTSNKGLSELKYGGTVTAFCFVPSSSASAGMNVFIGTTWGLFESKDNGASWNAVTSGLPRTEISSLAVSGKTMFAGLWNGRVFVSTDGGTTWNPTNTGLPNTKVSSLVAFPMAGANGETCVFAGSMGRSLLEPSNTGLDPGRGVFLSTNNGGNWNEVNNGLIDLDVTCLAVIGTDVYTGILTGAFRTTDNGASWTGVNNGLPLRTDPDDKNTPWPVYSFATSGSNIFAGGRDNGVYLSTNRGESWTAVKPGKDISHTAEAAPMSLMSVNSEDLWTLSDGFYRRPLAEMVGKGGVISTAFNQIDASGFPQIKALVTVTDSSQMPIAGLTSSNFSIKEDGVAESPLMVVPAGSSGSPVTVMIAVDKGDAMASGALARAKTTASNFVQIFQSSDSAAVLPFDNQVVMSTPFTSNKETLIAAMHGIVSGGKVSAIYDALYESVQQLKTRSGSKAILLISAGIDQSSQHGQSEILELLAKSNIPVYVIGFPVWALAEEVLAQIAKISHGAYYVEPGTGGLNGIYQDISSALKNQYRVTYTTHNTAPDGSNRTVAITTTYSNSSATQQKLYVAPLSTNASSVVPTGAGVVPVGQPFWVEVKVGDPNTVKDLYGLSFKLKSSLTSCTYVAGSATAGSFLGTGPLTFFQSPDAQTISATVTKTAAPGVNGSGIVARFQFTTASSLTSITSITFTLSDVQANTSTGTSIPMSLGSFTLSASPSASVSPGDCDNSGSVTAADVLPIGLYYGQKNATTPVTNNPGIQWQVYKRTFWLSDSLGKKVYADADGNGVIDGADVLAVGLNYSKVKVVFGKSVAVGTTSESIDGTLGILSVVRSSGDKRHVRIPIALTTTKPVYGVSFTLTTGTSERFTAADTTAHLFGAALMLTKASDDLGMVDIGITSLSGAGFTGTGELLTIELELPDNAATSVSYDLTNINAIDARGNMVSITGKAYRGAISETGQGSSIPTEYGLSQNYPNPFNPSTNFELRIANPGFVTLKVFDVLGRVVASLVHQERAPGIYVEHWDASGLPSGVYYSRMSVTELSGSIFTQTRRLMLVK